MRSNTIAGVRVSTVFLGLDHNFGEGDPVLWETMVFNDEEKRVEQYTLNGKKRRYISIPDLGQWRFVFMRDAYDFHDKKVRDLTRLLESSEFSVSPEGD